MVHLSEWFFHFRDCEFIHKLANKQSIPHFRPLMIRALLPERAG